MELIIILLVIIVGILLLFLVGWLLAPLGEAGKGLFQIGAWAVKKSMENREGPAPRPQHPGERSIGEVVKKREFEKAQLDERWREVVRKRRENDARGRAAVKAVHERREEEEKKGKAPYLDPLPELDTVMIAPSDGNPWVCDYDELIAHLAAAEWWFGGQGGWRDCERAVTVKEPEYDPGADDAGMPPYEALVAAVDPIRGEGAVEPVTPADRIGMSLTWSANDWWWACPAAAVVRR